MRNYEGTVKALLSVGGQFVVADYGRTDREKRHTVKRLNKDQVATVEGLKFYYYYVLPVRADGTVMNEEDIQTETRVYNDAENKRLRDERIERESNNEIVLNFVAALPDTLNAPVQDGDPWDSKFQKIAVTPEVWYCSGYQKYDDSRVEITLVYDYDENRNPVSCRAVTWGYADSKTWRTWGAEQIKRTADRDSGAIYRLTLNNIEYVTDYEIYSMLSDCENETIYAALFQICIEDGRIMLYTKPDDPIKSLPKLSDLNGSKPVPGQQYRLF